MLQRRVILTALMKGRFRMEPRTGILLIKPTATGKKPLGVMRAEREKERGEETKTERQKLVRVLRRITA